ncbi:hypothetical protein VTK56DRAFT_1327 [Thermocarpiscus australiensis]
MCVTFTNTRWACNKKGCKPEGKMRHSRPYYLKPMDFLQPCERFDYETGYCSEGRTENDTEIFYLSFECPTHHGKRLARIQETWEEEWDIMMYAETHQFWRDMVGRDMTWAGEQRDAQFKTLLCDAQRFNTEFYLAAQHCQARLLAEERDRIRTAWEALKPELNIKEGSHVLAGMGGWIEDGDL